MSEKEIGVRYIREDDHHRLTRWGMVLAFLGGMGCGGLIASLIVTFST